MKRFVRMGGCGMTKGGVERVCICTAAGAEGGTPALPAKAYVGEQQLQRAGDLVNKDQPAWPDLSHTEIYRIMNKCDWMAGKEFDSAFRWGDQYMKGKGSLLYVTMNLAVPIGVVVEKGTKVTLIAVTDLGSDDDSEEDEGEEHTAEAVVSKRLAAGEVRLIMMDLGAAKPGSMTKFSQGAQIEIAIDGGDNLRRTIQTLDVAVPTHKDLHPMLAPIMQIPPKIHGGHSLGYKSRESIAARLELRLNLAGADGVCACAVKAVRHGDFVHDTAELLQSAETAVKAAEESGRALAQAELDLQKDQERLGEPPHQPDDQAALQVRANWVQEKASAKTETFGSMYAALSSITIADVKLIVALPPNIARVGGDGKPGCFVTDLSGKPFKSKCSTMNCVLCSCGLRLLHVSMVKSQPHHR